LIQKELFQKQERVGEMRHDLQMTESQLETCLASVARKAEQLQQLDQQLSVVGTSGTVSMLPESVTCFNFKIFDYLYAFSTVLYYFVNHIISLHYLNNSNFYNIV